MENYDPAAIEEKWYRHWEDEGLFSPDDQKGDETYTIVIPPPNVTGHLHIGHALVNSLQDVLIRLKRMQGYKTLWLPGTDHAGIATQMVVDRELGKKGITKESLGREKFVEEIWKWKEQSGNMIFKQLRRIGASLDWKRERFTLDEGLSKAVRRSFFELHQEGLIYRGNYIVNWCPSCKTAISDLEVDHEEKEGSLTYIAYPLKDGDRELIVATTRPETMLGDTAVAVNPSDPRFRDFIGKEVVLPLTGRIIPVVGDDFVDIEFGTGAVKVTPAHDPNDFLIGKRHGLPSVNIFTIDAKINDAYPPLMGMDRFEARKKVVEALKEQGYFREVKAHTHAVGTCHRCKSVIEPRESTQWFCKMKDMAQASLDALDQGQIRFIPDHQTKIFREWMNNIQDWCLSRQLWWGHRIPAWYCGDCSEITVSELEELESCAKCGSKNIRQDEDVLDTWFSSGLFPFSTMGWPDKTEDLSLYYPNSVLVTGYDILFFWVARMVMMGIKLTGEVPFSEVFLHGLVRDEQGQKMSKTRGNVIDPLDIIEKYGADAMRFTLVSLTSLGRDIKLPEKAIEASRNFINKLWNAQRFTLFHLERLGLPGEPDKTHSGLFDRWILDRLEWAVFETCRHLGRYRFDEAARVLHNFVWRELCDWYLEIIKPILFDKLGETARNQSLSVLFYTLKTSLRLLHPMMPFVTEELFSNLPQCPGTLMLEKFPEARKLPPGVPEAERFIELISVIRNIRGENLIKPGQKVSVVIKTRSPSLSSNITCFSEVLTGLGGLKSLEVLERFDKLDGYAAGVGDEFEVFVNLMETIDPVQEIARLNKEFEKLAAKKDQIQSKLDKKDFLDKAPAKVIEKNKEELAQIESRIQKLWENLKSLQNSN